MRKIFKILFIVFLILLIGIISFVFFKEQSAEKEYQYLRKQVIVNTPSDSVKETIPPETTVKETEPVETTNQTNPDLEMDKNYSFTSDINFNELYSINKDYIAWLNIPGIDVSYPVVFPMDNEQYLKKDFTTGAKSASGTLFIDAFSDKKTEQDNLLIWGHNMKNYKMFGALKKLKDTDVFNQNKYIELYLKDEKRLYKIFSVRTVSSNINKLDYALNSDLVDNDDFTNSEYIQNAFKESIHSRTVEADYINNQIITLSTCVNDDSKRLLVSGIRVK